MWDYIQLMKNRIYLYSFFFFICSSTVKYGISQTPGLLYGVTSNGGSSSVGLIFNYDPLNSILNTVAPFDRNNGSLPQNGLVQATNGLLYGMAYKGGNFSVGTLISVDPTTNNESTLYNFSGADGSNPYGGLIQGKDNLLYGMTNMGGANGDGVLFSYNIITNVNNVLVNFNGTNGANPYGTLLQASNGLIYGMTYNGGTGNQGVFFSYSPVSGKDTVLIDFSPATGYFPQGGLIEGTNGLIYGMTSSGGVNGFGTIFSYNPLSGKDTVLVNFDNTINGRTPVGNLVQVSDSLFYGMTYRGGIDNVGTLFKFNNLSNKAVTRFSFNNTNGGLPNGNLIKVSDGSLYGMTSAGGANSIGVLFRYDTSRVSDSILVSFNGTNGSTPLGDVLEIMTSTLTNSSSLGCYGDSSGSAAIHVRGGHYPLTYVWSNGATTDSVSGLKAGNYAVKVIDQKGIADSFSFTITQPSQVHDSIAKLINVSCFNGNNGSITIGVAGGIKPYTYFWTSSAGTSATAIDLIAGSYTCTIKDSNNCVALVKVLITQPAMLKDSTASLTNVTCYGHNSGTATVGVAGGTKPYTYSWGSSLSSNIGTTASLSGLPAANYTCIVTDSNNCQTKDSLIITTPAKINTVTSFTPTPCSKNSGEVSVNIQSGGVPPFAYLWSPGNNSNALDTGLVSGSYTCTVTDSLSCIVSSVVYLPNVGGPKDSIISSSNNLCYGDSNGSATVRSKGGKLPYTYSWTPSGGNDTIAKGLVSGTYTFTTTDSTGCTGSATVVIIQPGQLRDSIAILTNVNCFGRNTGSVKIGIIGGTMPYKFNWSSGQAKGAYDSSLAVGTYTCKVSDTNNCPAPNIIVTITSPSAINIDTSVTIATCGKNNGSASVVVTGGVKPYSYSWSNGQTKASITGVPGGFYLMDVTDSMQCASKISVVVPDTGGPKAIIVSQINENCFGDKTGSAAVSAIGTPPYSYRWSSGINDTDFIVSKLVAGTYTCVVKDSSGCVGDAVVNIVQPNAINAIIKTIGVCAGSFGGGSANINVLGGIPPYTLNWSTGSTNDSITNAATGAYFCQVTDSNSCVVYAKCNIIQAKNITIDSLVVQPAWCNGCANGSVQVNVSGGVPPGDSIYYFYVWSNGSTGDSIINSLDTGVYSVCVISPYGCGSICDSTAVVTAISSVNNVLNSVKVFPDPSTGTVYFKMPLVGQITISVMNVMGEKIYIKEFNVDVKNEIIRVDLDNVASGLYYVKILSDKGVVVRKIALQK